MKDYSKYIPSSFGFITKYEIVGDKIYVYTPETKKGEPHVYQADKDHIAYFEARLETQYQLLIENRKVIEEIMINKAYNKVYWPFGICIGGLSTVAGIWLMITESLLCLPVFLITILTIITSNKIIENKENKFNREMDTIEAYLKNRHEIEILSKADSNVTEYLSKDAERRLTNNNNLIEQGKLDTMFNIEFMDKAQLKDLNKLLLRFMISKSLHEKQEFIIPESEKIYIATSKPKKKVRALEETNNQNSQ